jgi:FtsZ-binding cell division protein ZapB
MEIEEIKTQNAQLKGVERTNAETIEQIVNENTNLRAEFEKLLQ